MKWEKGYVSFCRKKKDLKLARNWLCFIKLLRYPNNFSMTGYPR